MSGIDDETVLLWVARETGVLAALLESADTPAEVAAEAGVTDRAARVLTHALADAGYFRAVDGAYEPTNRALGFLTRRDLRSVGSRPHGADLLARYRDLPEGIDAGPPADSRDVDGEGTAGVPTPEPENWTVHDLGATAATDDATVRALVTAAVRERPGADRVLDVGGAPGVYAVEFARRGFDPVLVDRAERIDPSRPLLAREPVELRAVEYDAAGAELPAADLAFLPDVTRRLGPGANRRLLGNVADALSPGGVVVVLDRFRDRSPRSAAAALEALATTGAGEVYPADRYREWLADAGFADPEVREVPGTDRRVVVARTSE